MKGLSAQWRLSPLYCYMALALVMGCSLPALGRDYFDPSLLVSCDNCDAPKADLEQFETAGSQAAGAYSVDVFVNNAFVRAQNITFAHDPGGKLQPVLSPAQLQDLGVDIKGVPALAVLPADKTLSSPLSAYIPQAATHLDFSRLRLNLSVPQLNMQPHYSETLDPDSWQEGMPAFLLNYSLNGSTNQRNSNGNNQENQYLFGSFQPGLNLGAWRLRNNSTYSYNQQRYDQYDLMEDAKKRTSRSQSRWSSNQTYLQRDIIPWRSQLTMGETSTGSVAGQVLDGFSYRGVNLASDESMLPGYMTGFAPVISGIAKSNALVSIIQNGVMIYQTNVAPGPFRINDLPGSSNSGDLVVTVTEADGSKHGFTQPYTTLPVMLRPGQWRYEVAGGQYYQGHGSYGSRQLGFGMGSLIYGLHNNVTLYGGTIMAKDYMSLALGGGFSLLSLGALSLDVTHSDATLVNNQKMSGESYRARFSKSMLSSGTTVDLTAYRYSTRNFLSFQDANTQGYNSDNGLPPWLNDRRRSSFEMRLSQQLWGNYSLWLSGRRDNYWGSDRTNTTLSSGLSSVYRGVSWGVNYSIDRMRGDGSWPVNRQMAFNVNVPMSLFGPSPALSNSYANYSISHDSSGRVSNQLGVGGSLLEDNSLNWSASESQGNKGQGNSGSVSTGYNGTYGQANLGYNYDNQGGRGVTYGMNGGLMVHQYGVTLAQRVGDAAVLVHTPGVSGVRVMNGAGTQTDYWGNAIVNAGRYRRNSIDIDPSSLPEGANLTQTSQSVYPTAGALVPVEYRIRTGQQLLMNLTYRGKPVPFGALAGVTGEKDSSQAAIVGDGGQVYLNGMPATGTLQVKWGAGADKQCHVPFSLGEPVRRSRSDAGWQALKTVNAVCR